MSAVLQANKKEYRIATVACHEQRFPVNTDTCQDGADEALADRHIDPDDEFEGYFFCDY